MPKLFFALLLTSLFGFRIGAQVPLQLDALPVAFSQPTDVVNDGHDPDLLYIVQQGGIINRYSLSDESVSLLLDLTDSVDARSEGGALGMAFHPRFPDSNYLYVNYTVSRPTDDGVLTTRISRFELDDQMVASDLSETILLRIAQPAANHNAGDLAFGPDGYLYVPTGDGGGAGDPYDSGQDPQSLLGKILRIDVDNPEGGRTYGIPADNPFVGSSDTLGEIFALGLRNPWRISFDAESGDLYIGDVGQGNREEIDRIPAGSAGGQNFGWNCREGMIAYTDPSDRCAGRQAGDFTEPIFDYSHDINERINGVSVTGGFVYRGPDVAIRGLYFFADFGRRRLFTLPAAGSRQQRVEVYDNLAPTQIAAFGEDLDGRLYAADYTGVIYRISSPSTSAVLGGGPVDAVLRASPNPTSGAVALDLDENVSGPAVVEWSGIDGRRVQGHADIRLLDGKAEVTLPRLPAGLYLLTVTAEGRRFSTRLVYQ